MRKLSPLSAILPPVRAEVLGAMLADLGREWYLSDLARHLGRRPSSLQRELALLNRTGVISSRSDGNRRYYRPDPGCPILKELEGILVKTTGVADVLRGILAPFGARIRLAYLYGSIARAEERSGSDADLMVVGDVGLAEIAPALRRAEQRIGRPVNVTVYSTDEYRSGLNAGENHFLASVAAAPIIPLIGNADNLEKTAR